ncbi:MAG TPA: thioredoxin fold domain-containing protein [Chitinophagaceae bacterium]|nr:thioredoxin fold domain-containing protein [Chitinophagaceae bacterium]
MKHLLGLLVSLPFLVQAQGIKFDESLTWEQVKAKAKAENKYIFADCFATWCGPCKAMDKNIYPNDTVGNAVNGKFISVKVQMDSSKQDNENVKAWYADARTIMQQYKVTAFPTFLFFSPDGKLVHKDLGYKKKEDFIALVNDATDPKKQYYTLKTNYEQGKKDYTSMPALARMARGFRDADFASSVAKQYISHLNKKDIFEKENLRFIKEFTRSAKDPGFSILYKNAEKVNNILGKDEAEAAITGAIDNDEIRPNTKKGATPDWSAIQKNVAKYGKLGEETLMQSQMLYAVNNKDWDLFNKVAKPWFEQYGSKRKWIADNSFLLNNVAWAAFENTSDKQGLEGALAMSATTIEKGGPTEWDTYANLLYKLGQKEKALEWEAKAAAGSPQDKGIQEAYEKMKKGEPSWPTK